MGKVGDRKRQYQPDRPTLSEIPVSLNLRLFPASRQNKYPFFDSDQRLLCRVEYILALFKAVLAK